MPTLTFDRPVPELTEEEDAQTMAAIEAGVAQLDAGRGIPVEEVRETLATTLKIGDPVIMCCPQT
jgi:predicted transcriptional regulator